MKTIKHIHKWKTYTFDGDPERWNCKVLERCLVCNKDRYRTPTAEECEAERVKRTCSDCGFPKDIHDDPENINSCITVMGTYIRDLKERLDSLERWREG